MHKITWLLKNNQKSKKVPIILKNRKKHKNEMYMNQKGDKKSTKKCKKLHNLKKYQTS